MSESLVNWWGKYKVGFVFFVFFLGLHFFLYMNLGVKTTDDSFKYFLTHADSVLKKGTLDQEYFFWYLGYVTFLAAIKCISNKLIVIVFAQIIMSGVAVVALYKTSKLLFNDTFTAYLTSGIYLLFFEIHYWSFFILAESFYCSIMCITLYCMVKTNIRPSFTNWSLTVVVCLITFLTKPTGVALLAAILLWLAFKNKEVILKQSRWLLLLEIAFLIGISYLLVSYLLQTFEFVDNYKLGEIVPDVTTLPNRPDKGLFTVKNSSSILVFPSANLPPIEQNLFFFIHNPIFFLKLAGLKLFWFLAHVKPYYSFLHNVFIAFTLYPLYVFFVVAMTKSRIEMPLKILFATIIVLNCLIVSVWYEDWDGRYIIPILPVLFLVACPEISIVIQKVVRSNKIAR